MSKLINTFNGAGLTLAELKKFVDECYDKYPDNIPVQFNNNEIGTTSIKSILCDDTGICFYNEV